MNNDEIDALWAQAIHDNDGNLAKRLFAKVGNGAHPFLEAIDTTPLPTQVMEAAMEEGLLNKAGWLTIALNRTEISGQPRDWATLLSWYGQRAGRDKMMAEIECTLDTACRSWPKPYAKQFLRAALDFEPTLASSLLAQDRSSQLMLLTVQHREDTWPERSGINLEEFIERAHFMGALTNCALTTTPGAISSLEVWISSTPQRTLGWIKAGQRDRAREEALDHWMTQWVPERTWLNSPLAQWCAGQDTDPTAQDPTESWRPFVAGEEVKERHDFAKRAFRRRAEDKEGVLLEEGLRLAINDQVGARASTQGTADFFGHQSEPLDLTLIQLAGGHEQAWSVMLSGAGKRQFQAWLNQDRRTSDLLLRKNLTQFVQCLTIDPEWQQWRDRRGASLLDLALDQFERIGAGTNLKRLERRDVLKLDNACPGLLTSPDARGRTPLTRMDVTDATRSAVLRQALKRTAGAGLRMPRPPRKI